MQSAEKKQLIKGGCPLFKWEASITIDDDDEYDSNYKYDPDDIDDDFNDDEYEDKQSTTDVSLISYEDRDNKANMEDYIQPETPGEDYILEDERSVDSTPNDFNDLHADTDSRDKRSATQAKVESENDDFHNASTIQHEQRSV